MTTQEDIKETPEEQRNNLHEDLFNISWLCILKIHYFQVLIEKFTKFKLILKPRRKSQYLKVEYYKPHSLIINWHKK